MILIVTEVLQNWIRNQSEEVRILVRNTKMETWFCSVHSILELFFLILFQAMYFYSILAFGEDRKAEMITRNLPCSFSKLRIQLFRFCGDIL